MLLWRSAMVLVSIIYSTSSATSHNRQLFFGLLGHQENSRAQRGVEDALDVINNRTDILLGYALRSTYMPTELQVQKS